MARPVIAVLNGPNLNLLGEREPQTYGSTTLADVQAQCAQRADALGYDIDFRQSNHEGALVDWIHELRGAAGVVINPAAYTHTSVAIRDALVNVAGPVVEVHISNVHAREEFRHHSYVSAVASGVIVGLGVEGYVLALSWLASTTSDR